MTAENWRRSAAARLLSCGDEDAEWDARLFLCAVLGCEPGELQFRRDENLTNEKLRQLERMLERRISGEPEQYIEGCAWFMGLRFLCDKRALIPRQDTETLCEFALDSLKKHACAKVLDLCTGSGILAVAIKKAFPSSSVTASDISSEALELASENARMHNAEVRFVKSDGFNELRGERFDLIVCNPPYLTKTDMDELPELVRREPSLALYGGTEGLDFYRKIAPQLHGFLTPEGCAAFETGDTQAGSVAGILRSCGLSYVEIVRDINQKERVVVVRK